MQVFVSVSVWCSCRKCNVLLQPAISKAVEDNFKIFIANWYTKVYKMFEFQIIQVFHDFAADFNETLKYCHTRHNSNN